MCPNLSRLSEPAGNIFREVAGSVISDLGRGSTNAILMYHSVEAPNSTFYGNIDQSKFVSDLDYITEHFQVVDLPKVIEPQKDKRKIAITFDDGLSNFYTNVFPIVKREKLPVTVFVCPEFIEKYDHRRVSESLEIEYENRIVMTLDELQDVAACEFVNIGNHTLRHEKLPNCSYDLQRKTIIKGKRQLEEIIGSKVDCFCYPYGEFTQETLDIVGSSHAYGVTADPGLVDNETDLVLLPRIPAHISRNKISYYLYEFNNKYF